jgi:hypothetical protein
MQKPRVDFSSVLGGLRTSATQSNDVVARKEYQEE